MSNQGSIPGSTSVPPHSGSTSPTVVTDDDAKVGETGTRQVSTAEVDKNYIPPKNSKDTSREAVSSEDKIKKIDDIPSRIVSVDDFEKTHKNLIIYTGLKILEDRLKGVNTEKSVSLDHLENVCKKVPDHIQIKITIGGNQKSIAPFNRDDFKSMTNKGVQNLIKMLLQNTSTLIDNQFSVLRNKEVFNAMKSNIETYKESNKEDPSTMENIENIETMAATIYFPSGEIKIFYPKDKDASSDDGQPDQELDGDKGDSAYTPDDIVAPTTQQPVNNDGDAEKKDEETEESQGDNHIILNKNGGSEIESGKDSDDSEA